MDTKTVVRKELVLGIVLLCVGASVVSGGSWTKENISSSSQSDSVDSNEDCHLNPLQVGSLSGYVTDPWMNPLTGALVRVYFHETYEEDYTDFTGYYHVTNIPLCYCMKNATASKEGYLSEWVLLSIGENTTYDFVLTPLGNILYVGGSGPGNYTRIQDAITAASNGDTVFVYDESSPYYENVVINKSVHLLGENKNTTIIDGGYSGDTVSIVANNSVVTRFTVQHCSSSSAVIHVYSNGNTIQGNILRLYRHAVYLYQSNDNTIVGNTIIDSYEETGYSIYLRYATHNTISHNTLINPWYKGMYISSSSYNTISGNIIINPGDEGIGASYSHHNTYMDNMISGAGDFGMFIGYQAAYSNVTGNQVLWCGNDAIRLYEVTSSHVSGNVLMGSDYCVGLYFEHAYNNTIFDNLFSINSEGVYLDTRSNNNIFYHNNFIDNIDRNVYDRSTNIWDNGAQGNYWDDYTGEDGNGDGIGDTPYLIYGGNTTDRYPLMQPWNYTIPEHYAVVYVDDNYDESTPGWGIDHFNVIQDGVMAVEDNGTVLISSGHYYQHPRVYKALSLIGEDKNTTIIDGSGIRIIADGVVMRGFTVQHGHYYGINIGASYVTVTDNIITDNDEGVILLDATHTLLSNNIIKNNNSGLGIQICHGTSNNTIKENIIMGNYMGIWICCICQYLYVYHNNFIRNTEQVSDDGHYPEMHFWDDGYPSGGNYWDDYTGVDHYSGPGQNQSGPDGIGDTPYDITSYGYPVGHDYYPLMLPWGVENTDVDSVASYLTLTDTNMPGLTTCPAGDGPVYEYITVTCINASGAPLSGIPAYYFTFEVLAAYNAYYYGTLSCTFTPVDAETDENGEIRFTIQGDTSIVGDIYIQVHVFHILVHDFVTLSCKSMDYAHCDGGVDLADFTVFGQDYGTHQWRSDFTWDGHVSLGDFVLFGQHYGHQYA